MSRSIAERLRQLVGIDAVEWSPSHLPRVLPPSTEAVAAVCGEAHAAGWRIRVEGQGTWLPTDAPADLVLGTAALDRVREVHARDLVATAEAGVTMARLAQELAHHGAWLAVDPPGRPERSLGSVVASGTTGALRHRLGPVRDQVIGCTVVTGDGRVITAGGRVTKNVAGYDLMKLQVGGFGAFGIITELHLRLRALPAADLTLVARGERDPLTLVARTLEEAGLDAACCELWSPAAVAESTWALAIRLIGPEAAVRAEADRVRQIASPLEWGILMGDRAASFWSAAARAMGGGQVSIRLGVLAEGVDEALDLLRQRLDLGLVAAGAARGSVRWSGDAEASLLRELRHHFAAREVPLTLERAPWTIRSVTGHFGAYREGIGPLVGELRQRFDPSTRFQVCLDGLAGE